MRPAPRVLSGAAVPLGAAVLFALAACVDTSRIQLFGCGEGGRCAEGSVCCDGFCRAGTSCDANEGCDGGLRCNGECVDANSDERHCGACGTACVADQTCVGGRCLGRSCDGMECGPTQVCVSGTCREKDCLDVICNADSTCVGGACVPRACEAGLCPPGHACLDGGCVDVGCTGVTCADGGVCALGRCDGNVACGNMQLDPPESDVDCGGTCPPCIDGRRCNVPGDCASAECGDGGVCVAACADGATCGDNPGAPCRLGRVQCTAGVASCVDGPAADDGTLCGAGLICVSGACVPCTEGAACSTNSDPCKDGVMSCSPSVSCVNGTTQKPAGASCGVDRVCNASGNCIACAEGAACTGNPGGPCKQGVLSCATGTPQCVDGPDAPTGTSCGVDKICRAGVCITCAAGQACATNPGAPCKVGTTTCGATVGCDDGMNAPAGTACGSNQVCNGNGQCVACASGQACTTNPGAPCTSGIIDCSTGTPRCVDSSPLPAGTACGTNLVCNGNGSCVACTAGQPCTTNPSACRTGVTSCSTGVQTCVDSGNKPAGTACGSGQVCDGNGFCGMCTADQVCSSNPTPCKTGKTSCSTGTTTCVDDVNKPAGTSCGTNMVCDGAGACVACTAGQSCTTNPGVCRTGLTSCATGAQTCVDSGNKPAGTPCGTDMVCNGSGACVACKSGQPCSTNPSPCRTGVTSCTTGSQQCIDSGNKAAGTSCGTNQVCDGSGGCVACTAGLACTTNPNAACMNGVTSCSTGAQTCVDGAPKPAGTSCGTNMVCNGSGSCVSCTAGLSCTTNPNAACRYGVTSCSTGAQTCVDGTPKPAGTSCGTNQVCDGNGYCGMCTAGQACTTNPNVCKTGVTSCSTGSTTCVDDANKPAGTSCGTNMVCNGSGSCVSCTEGVSCTTNPGAACRYGVTSCSTGAQTCIDGTPKPAGTSCGTNMVCDGSGNCVSCTAGQACTTNPGASCRKGITSCSTGTQTCVDQGNAPFGTPCGGGAVCDGQGQCGAVSCPHGCFDQFGVCVPGDMNAQCGQGGIICVNWTQMAPSCYCDPQYRHCRTPPSNVSNATGVMCVQF